MDNQVILHVTFDLDGREVEKVRAEIGAPVGKLDRMGRGWLAWRLGAVPRDVGDTGVYERMLDELLPQVHDLRARLGVLGVGDFEAVLHFVMPVAGSTETQHLYAMLPPQWIRLLGDWGGVCEFYVYHAED